MSERKHPAAKRGTHRPSVGPSIAAVDLRLDETREIVQRVHYQRCGGGRRAIRKRIGGDR